MTVIRVPESAGWIFFLVLFILLVYPLYLVMAGITIDTEEATASRITFSIFGAAMAAAVFTWLANLLLERITLWAHQPDLEKKGPVSVKSSTEGPPKGKKPNRKKRAKRR